MSPSPLLLALGPVLDALDALPVRWHVGGSVASSLYGVARTTIEVDDVAELKRPHVAPLLAALGREYYASEPAIVSAIQRESCFNLIHLATSYKVDVFVAKHRAFDQSGLARAHRDTLGERLVFVASPEDVILNKLEWYRMGNEVSERQWQDVLGVLKVQQDTLDRAYLASWAAELGISELLSRALGEAGIER